MTVQELINALAEMPPDANVVLENDVAWYGCGRQVTKVSVDGSVVELHFSGYE